MGTNFQKLTLSMWINRAFHVRIIAKKSTFFTGKLSEFTTHFGVFPIEFPGISDHIDHANPDRDKAQRN
jgi:hypothetical protein